MTVFAKKGDRFKRLKKKKKQPPFFPHQCFNSTDVIFLFDFSKFIFLCLLSLVDQKHLCNCGLKKKKTRREKELILNKL